MWSPPADDGGSPIQSYRATVSPGGQSCTVSTAVGCTVSGLVNGTTYIVSVTASNALGESPPSVPSPPVTPRGSPSAPRNVQLQPGDGKVIVRWSPPASDGGATIMSYSVVASPGGQGCVTAGALTCTVAGLVNGTSYSFSVTAANSIGVSPQSLSASRVRPEGRPGAVQDLRAVAARKAIKVSWKAPLERGGSLSLRYEYQVGRQAWKPVRGTSVQVKGAPGSKVTVKVRAVTAGGPGPVATIAQTPL